MRKILLAGAAVLMSLSLAPSAQAEPERGCNRSQYGVDCWATHTSDAGYKYRLSLGVRHAGENTVVGQTTAASEIWLDRARPGGGWDQMYKTGGSHTGVHPHEGRSWRTCASYGSRITCTDFS
ncbi:hypothetical protein D5S17_07430 [Pseudonocardiaceae bacterium YIM PH 21723]|nr:hypothetical protein D5S17_07430 [Pseudonocardiaceae bacterium YIM PH 21723]